MSADTLAIAAQAIAEWLTALAPTTIEYRISERYLGSSPKLQEPGCTHTIT